jgi:hypothetical protein
MQKPNLLLIRGLGHSGTTILDLALGAHPRIAGLGEAARILQPRPEDAQLPPVMLRGELRFRRRCSCGRMASDCPVWGPYLEWLIGHDDLAMSAKARQLLEAVVAVKEASGQPVAWVVESTQSDRLLVDLASQGFEIRVVFLVRDVRSWCNSNRRKTGQSDARAIVEWLVLNQRMEGFLRKSGLPVFGLGYEELALAPVKALTSLCRWLGLDFHEAMLEPLKHTSSHVLAGNRIRQRASSNAISYDGTWLSSGSWLTQAAALLPFVGAKNRRCVYGNGFLQKFAGS